MGLQGGVGGEGGEGGDVGGLVLLIPSRWVCLTSGGVGGLGLRQRVEPTDASRPDNSDVLDSADPPALAQKFSYMLIWG